MPHIFDFEKVANIKTSEVYPIGWISPIMIEYGNAQVKPFDNFISVCWRIKGTTHTFTIPLKNINFISKGQYDIHFKEVLEKFLEDYKEWEKTEFQYEWQQQYREQYERFIL